MAPKLPNPLIAVVIVGNGWTHACSQKKEVHFPSVVGIEQSAFTSVDLGDYEFENHPITWDDITFVVGKDAYDRSRISSGTMGSDKVGSVTHRRLFIAALYKLFGPRDIQPDVVITTLPVLYYDSRDERDQMKTLLSGDYQIEAGGKQFCYSISADAIKVIPEGLPTVVDQIYNRKLEVQRPALATENVAVVNIGTFTTDLILIEGQKPITARCRSIDYGLHQVWSDVIQKARQYHGRTLSQFEADNAVKNGYFMSGNKKIEVKEWADATLEQVAEAIANEIAQLWDSGLAVQHIISAGGGGPQFDEYLYARYRDRVNYIHFNSVEEAAATEMHGCWKFAQIKLSQG